MNTLRKWMMTAALIVVAVGVWAFASSAVEGIADEADANEVVDSSVEATGNEDEDQEGEGQEGENSGEEDTEGTTETYDYLVFTKGDGSQESLSVSELEMTFSEGQLVAVNGDGTVSLSLEELASMQFSNEKVEESEPDAIQKASVTLRDGDVEIFSASGMSLGKYGSFEAAQKVLPSGVYVAKQASGTYKFRVK